MTSIPAPSNPRRKWVIGAVALAVCLVLAEVALRAYGLCDPVLYQRSERFGYEPIPGQTVRPRGIEQRFDETGYRVPVSSLRRRPHATIAFLGDSVTYGGSSIPTDDTFVERLNRALSYSFGILAYNGGVNSYSIAQMANRYMHRLRRDSDQIVVVFFISQDWYRAPTKYLLDGGPLYLEKPSFALVEAANLFRALALKRPPGGGGFEIPADVTGDESLRGRVADDTRPHFFDENCKAAAQLIAFCRERDIIISFVHLPGHKGLPAGEDARTFLQQQDVLLLDLADKMKQLDADEVYADRNRLTAPGHDAVARLLLESAEIWAPILGQM